MKIVLEPARDVAGYRFAAICAVQASTHRAGDRVFASGRKTPVAILVRPPTGATLAIRADGELVGADWVEARCPGAWSRFETGGGDGQGAPDRGALR